MDIYVQIHRYRRVHEKEMHEVPMKHLVQKHLKIYLKK